NIKGLLHQVKAYEQLTIEAAVEGNYDKALMALTNNPLVPDIGRAKSILDDILAVNAPYLPQFKLTTL
ncbi:6-phospho-beta-glucosidase, partial [Escherichia coli]|nr:6-phospho-beta-glucosidase [Escherichia coli]